VSKAHAHQRVQRIFVLHAVRDLTHSAPPRLGANAPSGGPQPVRFSMLYGGAPDEVQLYRSAWLTCRPNAPAWDGFCASQPRSTTASRLKRRKHDLGVLNHVLACSPHAFRRHGRVDEGLRRFTDTGSVRSAAAMAAWLSRPLPGVVDMPLCCMDGTVVQGLDSRLIGRHIISAATYHRTTEERRILDT
jgi:hypothetical protein